jgi:hypothetical protein
MTNARARIILVEPEQQRDAAPARTAPAPKLMFNINEPSKMSQTKITVSYFSKSILNNLNKKKS